MQRRAKINKIKELLNEIRDKKQIHVCDKMFYSDKNYLYEDREHFKRVSQLELDTYCEKERIKHNAVQAIYITIHNILKTE